MSPSLLHTIRVLLFPSYIMPSEVAVQRHAVAPTAAEPQLEVPRQCPHDIIKPPTSIHFPVYRRHHFAKDFEILFFSVLVLQHS